MDTKDKFSEQREILQFISQTHRLEFDRRRVYEWRVLLSTLTLYILAISGKLSGKVSIPDTAYVKYLLWLICIGLALLSIWYLFRMHAAHGINKHLAEISEHALIERSGIDPLKKIQESLPKGTSTSDHYKLSVLKNNWAWRWQVVVLLSVAIVTAVIYTL